jgi:hypothetical protein
MRALLEARGKEPAPPPPSEFEVFLESLNERFHPDRVNAHLWHCRTQEEFDEERDRIWDEDDELYSRPDLDGGNDTWFTDRN